MGFLTANTSSFKPPSAPSLGVDTSAIKNAINLPFGAINSGMGGNKSFTRKKLLATEPWSDDENPFFPSFEIQPNRWNQMYPYRLLVVDVSQSPPQIVGSDAGSNTLLTQTRMESTANSVGGIDYVLSEAVLTSSWICNLPITPQQLSIVDQYAINTTATMRGIAEEHNGVKFKLITASGTTGIWPKRPTTGASIKTPSALASVFSGTLAAATEVKKSFGKIAKAFSGGTTSGTASTAQQPVDSLDGEYTTGYYQALYLSQFLERYAMSKKDPKNRHWRLVLDIPKQNQSFVITPVQFSLNQSQQKPMEMLFNFQFKAWKRINLKSGVTPAASKVPKLNANLFQKINNTIRAARSAIASTKNLITAVRSDIQKVFNTLRQIALAIKDIAGLIKTVIDFPGSIINDFKSMVINEWKSIGSAFSGIGGNSTTSGTPTRSATTIKSTDGMMKARTAVSYVKNKDKINEGLSSDAIANGALGKDAALAQQTDSIDTIFDNPEEYFDLFDSVDISNLPLNEAQSNAIDEEIQKVRLLTVEDFRNFKQDLLSLSLDISNNYGSGDSVYSTLYSRSTPKTRPTPLTVEENEVLENIFEVIQCLDYLTSTKTWDDLHYSSPLQYVGGLANLSEIPFEIPQAKILVPVPYGLTIEEIAARYLGNTDRYLEIATLNMLRSPYIDEIGFTYSLLSNASGRQFNVDDSDNQIYIGQQIILKSSTVPSFVRNVIDRQKISDINYLITVDGDADLDTLTTAALATMQGYQGGTVNSQNQIYIPIAQEAQVDDRAFTVTNIGGDQQLTAISKIDFLLTNDFDIAINGLGDFRLANGLTNLLQCLMIKIKTRKGTLLRHLDFGLGLKHGISVVDLQSGEIINTLNKMIANDSRFESIDKLDLRLSGATLAISMSVVLAHNNGVLPISFDIKL